MMDSLLELLAGNRSCPIQPLCLWSCDEFIVVFVDVETMVTFKGLSWSFICTLYFIVFVDFFR